MKQTCILILGMHRSGTSALSGTLNILDVYLGSDLMVPSEESNPKGFYENQTLFLLNEGLLKKMGSSWDDMFYDESKFGLGVDSAELEEVLMQEFKYSRIFAIKDPRLAYLFPLYEKALTNLDIAIKIVIPFRNPLEVAESLKTRNHFSREKGLLLWANNFLISENKSRAYPRVFIRFDDLLNSPRKVIKLIDERLGVNLSSKFEEKEKQVLDFLTPRLKHHNIALDNLSEKVPKMISDIVDVEPHLDAVGSASRCDEIRTQLIYNQALFYNSDIVGALKELEQIASLSQAVIERDGQIASLSQAVIERDGQIASLSQEGAEYAGRLRDLGNDLERNCERLLRLGIDLNKERSRVQAIQESTSWRVTLPLREARTWMAAPKQQAVRAIKWITRLIKRM